MFVLFESLAPSSRVWIYQSDSRISQSHKEVITEILRQFSETWAAHGHPLRASFSIQHDHFVIIGVDESFNDTSGCSIDSSVRAIKQVAEATGLDFFNRNLIAFLKPEGVSLIKMGELKEKYQSGMWNVDSLTFNNLINTKAQLTGEWMIKAGASWLKRYVPQQSVRVNE
jgi:hypothetical protein